MAHHAQDLTRPPFRPFPLKVRGLPAWFMHRSYHLSRIPTLNRKIRVLVDWTLQLVLRREVVALGSLHEPREPFLTVAPPIPLQSAAKDTSAGRTAAWGQRPGRTAA